MTTTAPASDPSIRAARLAAERLADERHRADEQDAAGVLATLATKHETTTARLADAVAAIARRAHELAQDSEQSERAAELAWSRGDGAHLTACQHTLGRYVGILAELRESANELGRLAWESQSRAAAARDAAASVGRRDGCTTPGVLESRRAAQGAAGWYRRLCLSQDTLATCAVRVDGAELRAGRLAL